MKGDFSRFPYHAPYSLVLMQQGRVQLDADWNEQAMIQWFSLQKLAEDLIGEHGGPMPIDSNSGVTNFKITKVEDNNGSIDFKIGKGRYYVKGVLCENNDEDCTFLNQRNYPNPEKIEEEGQYLVYLHVWFRHITDVQDDAIREVALNGADTATRVKTVWQVKVVPFKDSEERATEGVSNNEDIITTKEEKYLKSLENSKEDMKKTTGLLKVQTNTEHKTDDSCSIPPQNRYRGIENQLYRVEIHNSGYFVQQASEKSRPTATFKWSRENGAVVFPIAEIHETTVVLKHLGRDERCGLKEGDWVEVMDDSYELQGKTEDLLQVTSVDSVKMEVTLSGIPNFGRDLSKDPLKHPFLRRWDGKGKVVEKEWITLEEGIQIQFTEEKIQLTEEKNMIGGTMWFRSGDWWWIPARTATGDVEWPKKENGEPPFDQGHRYAPLAIINNSDVTDLRRLFKPLGYT